MKFPLLLLAAPLAASAYELVLDDRGLPLPPPRLCRETEDLLGSVLHVAQRIAYKMMQMYPGNKTDGIPGLFGDPYYWWESGAVFGVRLCPYLGR